MKTLSPVVKSAAQVRPKAASPFFCKPSQPGATFFAPAVQAQLEFSQPGNPHEVEADRMADHVMRTLGEPFFAPASPGLSVSTPTISRVLTPPAAPAPNEEPAVKENEEVSESIQRMADPWFTGGAGEDESAPGLPLIQRRAMGPTASPPVFGAFSASHFAARSPWRRSLVPAQATISSEWVTRTPARSRPDKARGPPRGGESFTNLLGQSKGRGQPLPKQARTEMESTFGIDFGAVRVHAGDEAHRLANRASALAFAHEGDVYFNRGQFQPDTAPGKRLLAHELTHVVQQGRAIQPCRIQRQPFSQICTHGANGARAPPSISSAEPKIQRIGWSDIKEEINSYAELIHGYTLMTVVVGYNPILDENVEWTAKNFFRGVAGLIPFGTLIFDRLDQAGVIDSAFSWITSQIDSHNLTLARVNSLFSQAWDQMDFVRLDPVDYNVEVVRSTFSGVLSDVADFASACADKLIEIFKDLAIKAVRALFGEDAPLYDLICQVLGQDPLTGEAREWNTANFLRSILLLFGFENHLAKMEETGQLEKAAAWIDVQVGLLISAYSGLILGVIDLWTSLSLEKLIHPDELLGKTLSIVLTYVGKLSQFAFNVAAKVLELVKEALITLLKAHVHKVPGYPLFTVVLGMDPVTGEEVPRTPENFLKGFLSFVPKGIETYENIKASGALPKAMEWLLSLINELGLSPSQLLERFLTLWNSFTIDDLMNPIGAYIRIAEAYLSYVADVMMLVLRVYWKVLEIMFVFLLGPAAARVVAALKQGENTFRLIIEDPVGFFGNLLAAIGKGIKQFGSNIWKHIQGGLIGWMLGSLQGAGIEMPEKFDLKGVVSIVMQLLGLAYRQIRPLLVKRLGENVVSGLEKTFEFLQLFLKEGFAGVWRQFLEWIGDLKGIVIQAVTEWVVTKIVMVGLTKLATLWNPVGWVVEAVLAIYNTIMFFIERMEQILDFVEAVVQSINNIASGKLQQAADYVEAAMARTIPVIISFCTSLIGLGGISSKIRGVIQKVQDKVHKAIDTMIDWIVTQARKLGKALLGGEPGPDTPESDAVKREAARRLRQLITGPTRFKDVMSRVHQVEDDLRPQGLRSLEIEESDGEEFIVAKASVPNWLFKLTGPNIVGAFSKETSDNPARTVVVGTQLTLKPEASATTFEGVGETRTIEAKSLGRTVTIHHMPPAVFDTPFLIRLGALLYQFPPATPEERARLNTALMEQSRRGGFATFGGFVTTEKPDVSGNEVILARTWNTGLAGTCETNVSHAEAQLVRWLGQQTTVFKSRILSISVEVRDYSPCTLCVESLNSFLTAENKNRSKAGEPAILATIKWTKFYNYRPGPACHSSKSIEADLAAAGWDVSGAGGATTSGVAPPSGTSAPPPATSDSSGSTSEAAVDPEADVTLTPVTPKLRDQDCQGGASEREADAMAERSVMPACGSEKIKGEASRVSQGNVPPSSVVPIDSKVGRGESLPVGARELMQGHFGVDFSGVRIYTNDEADRLNRQLKARAFAHGSDIYFASGEYDPHSRRGQYLLAHELTHVVQQRAAGPSIQRQADPAHDLTAPGLAGDSKLEEIFDEKGSLGPPTKGPEVKKVQEALLALGFALPKFGADGDYGSETRQAVRDFQTKAGLTGAQVDGIVGPVTLGLLDHAARQGSVTTDTDAAQQDLKVTGKATSKLEDHLNKDGTPKEPVRVFFEFDSEVVTSEEKDKLKALHDKFPTQSLTLKGLASEEGSASHNLALADKRREAVKSVLRDEHKHDPALLADHKSEVAKGNIEYKKMRAVDVAIGGIDFKKETIVDTKKKADGTCTPEETKKVIEAVEKAVPEGVKWIADVRKELPPTKPATADLFDKLFGVRATDPKARAAERDSAVAKVNGILDKLSPHLESTKRSCATDADLKAGGCNVCRNEQDGGCAAGSPAYNIDTTPQAAGITHVCTSFTGETFDEQVTILIHEAHHGTPGIPSSDLAYSHTRLITAVSTASALENAASFQLYIRLVKRPGSVEVGHEKTPDIQVGLSDADFAAIQTLLGLLEQWLSLSTFDLSNVYSAIRRARTFGAWQSEDQDSRFEGMGRVAPRFGLTPPAFLPSERDQTGLAAIYDRFRTMEQGVKQQLTIEKTATGPSEWALGPGKSLKLPEPFFAEPRNKQMTWLMQELVSATPDISAGLEPRYVALIDDLRLSRNLPLNP